MTSSGIPLTLKFLMAPKVGISACMLDEVPSRTVGVYLEGFGGKILSSRCSGMGAYSLGVVLDFVFFFASAHLMGVLKVYTSACILHDRYWYVFGDRWG